MKTVGIISEYNPFHKGHEYHISKAKQLSGADAVICVMSGNFMQRGDVALLDKFTRAKSALMGGADLVVELPCVYSLSCAEKFAYGGVSILNALGADFISFGAECADLSTLKALSEILLNETAEFKALLLEKLKSGMSYQRARDVALSEIYDADLTPLSKPNNALAIEYLKALSRTNSKAVPVPIKRKGAGYNSKKLDTNRFASASGIREYLKSASFSDELEAFISKKPLEVYKNAFKSGKKPVFLADLDDMILYKLRTMDKSALAEINDVSEGLENRIYDMAKKASSAEELINLCSGKRYTKSRIARIVLCALLNIRKQDVKEVNYIRVLGMTDKGAKILSSIKKSCPLPVITKLAKYEGNCDILKFDILASDIYSILSDDTKKADTDYTTSPVVIRENEENYVYILKCGDNTYYTGWTNNLEKRFEDHKAGRGAKYTKGRGPLKLVYFEKYADKSSALKRECEIKKLPRTEKEKLIEKKTQV